MKVSMHNGREGSATHNDRNFDVSKARNVDAERMAQNCYWSWDGQEFRTSELAWYQRYKAHLDATNQRYIEQRHPEKCRSIEDLYKRRTTKPTETIWQVGNRDDNVSADMLMACYKDFCHRRALRTGDHLHVMDWAMHADEEGGPHIHERSIWEYKDDTGHPAIGQNRALSALGYERPNMQAPEGRYNNAKMSYDAEMRALWQETCRDHGLTIDSVPVPGRRHLDTEAYIYERQRDRMEQNRQRLIEARQRLTEATEELDSIRDASDEERASLEHLRLEIEASKAKIQLLERSESDQNPLTLFGRKLVKAQDYDALQAQAAVGRSIESASQELAMERIEMRKQESTRAQAQAKEQYNLRMQILAEREHIVASKEYYMRLGMMLESIATEEQREQARSHQDITKARD